MHHIYLHTPVLFGKMTISLLAPLVSRVFHPIIQSCQEAGCSVNVQTSAAFDCNAALMNFFRDLTVVKKSFPETNIAFETLGLEDEFSFGKASWQVLW